MQKTLKQPGVHVWKSKVSGQYFTAIQVKDSKESVARCIKFVNPELTPEEIDKLVSTNDLFDGNFVHFKSPTGTEHRLRIGSYLCKNMYGTLINLDDDHFNSIMTPVADEDKETALANYFFITATVSFSTITSVISYACKIYDPYPSKTSIKETVIQALKEHHSIPDGTVVSVSPTNIQRLTELEFIAFNK